MTYYCKVYTKEHPRGLKLADDEWTEFDRTQLHRLDGPAFELLNGTKEWYINGILHRLDGPAVELASGDMAWYVDGKLHRLDLTNECDWCMLRNEETNLQMNEFYSFVARQGKTFPCKGPAVEYANGSKMWYVNGERHRLDGPATEYANGTKEWWVSGERKSTKEVEAWLKEHNIDLTTSNGQMAFTIKWS